MSQINVRNLSNENDDGAPDIVGVSTFSATSYFVPPVGTTEQRPENPQSGDLRFNTDTASLEYFKGDILNWSQIEMTSPDLDGGARGLIGGGNPTLNVVQYLTIKTLGDTQDYGDLSGIFKQIFRDTEGGKNFSDAIRTQMRNTDSSGLRKVLSSLIMSIEEDTNVIDRLRSIAEKEAKERRVNLDNFIEGLSSTSEQFIIVSILIPIIFMSLS